MKPKLMILKLLLLMKIPLELQLKIVDYLKKKHMMKTYSMKLQQKRNMKNITILTTEKI